MVKPSQYVPTGKSLELLALALDTYTKQPKIMAELDEKTVDQLAIEWSLAVKDCKSNDDPQALIHMTERTHIFILSLLRDTTLVTSAALIRKMNLTGKDKSEVAEVKPKDHEVMRDTVRSVIEPGYNFERLIKEHTEQGEEQRISEGDWQTLTRPYGDGVTVITGYFGARKWEVHYLGPDQAPFVVSEDVSTVQ